MKNILFLLGILCILQLTFAKEVEITLKLEKDRVFLGESLQLDVKVHLGERDSAVDIQSLVNDFKVKSLGRQYSNIDQSFRMNGQYYREYFNGYIFSFSLQPKKTGYLAIGPIKVTSAGKEYYSPKKSLFVSGIEVNPYAFVEIHSSKSEYILEESFNVSVKVYIERLQGKYRDVDPFYKRIPIHLQIPWETTEVGLEASQEFARVLQPYYSRRLSSGFTVNKQGSSSEDLIQRFFQDDFSTGFGLQQGRAKFYNFPRELVRKEHAGKEREFFCYTLPFSFRGKTAGLYSFGPVIVRGTVPYQKDNSGHLENKLNLIAPTFKIKIAEPPVVGRPTTFSGAIGSFQVETEALSKKAEVGEPVTLVIKVTGEGNWDRVLAPKLSEQELGKNFQVYDDKVAIATKDGYKEFRYIIRAKNDQVTEISPVLFSFFSLQGKEYKTVNSEKIPITISPAAVQANDSTPVLEKNLDTPQANLTKVDEEGIYPIYPSPVLQFSTPDWQKWQIIYLLSLPLLAMAFVWIRGYQNKINQSPEIQRKKKAFSNAQNLLTQAKELQGSKEFYQAVQEAVIGQIGDYLTLNSKTLVTSEVVQLLKQHEFESNFVQEVEQLLAHCNQVQYGAFAMTANDQEEILRKSNSISMKLEDYFRKGGKKL